MKFKTLKDIVFVVCMLSTLPSVTLAGDSSGQLDRIFAHVGDVAMFAAGPHANRPSCSLNNGDEWALSLATHTGRAMFATILSAQAQGKPVTVMGSGLCDAWSDRESPLYIILAK